MKWRWGTNGGGRRPDLLAASDGAHQYYECLWSGAHFGCFCSRSGGDTIGCLIKEEETRKPAQNEKTGAGSRYMH